MDGQPTSDQEERPSPIRSVLFLVLSFPLRIVQFVLIVTFGTIGLATLPILGIGVPLLLLTVVMAYTMTDLERRWVATTLRIDVPPVERPVSRGSPLPRLRSLLTAPVTWRDLAYLVLMLPLGVIEFALGLTSIVLMPLALWVAPSTAWVHGRLAQTLLGPPRARRAEEKASRLQASRARGVDAAEAERRRIERDLHDGVQQRLVILAMNLGRTQEKLNTEQLEEARTLLDEAHIDAKSAVSELRDLARGIHPPVLADRGLDAALSTEAAKAPIPVQVRVTTDPRPPAAVETIAYFIVSETLTNAAKHATATAAEVTVERDGDHVIVTVSDNGRGGAEIRPGGGLAGLADRAATIDGVITVVSPPGGPTVVRADLPCNW